MEKIKCYCGHTDYCDCGPLELPARTAMQEFLDLIKTLNKGLWAELHDDDIIDKAIEKEKEQIINAFEDGYKSCDIDEAFEINIKLASGEQYYNQKFNK